MVRAGDAGGDEGAAAIGNGGWTRRALVAAALVLLVVLVAVLRLRTYHEPLERDLATYAVIAHEMLAGRPLYSDLWDHKPPAIHLTYAAAERVAGEGPLAVYLLGVAAATATLLALHLAAAANGRGAATGLLAAALFAVVSGDLALQGNQPNTEVFLNATLTPAVALLLRAGDRPAGLGLRSATVVGLLFALASLYKPTAVLVALPLMLAHLAFPGRAGEGPRAPRRQAIAEVVVVALVGAVAWGALLFSLARGGHLAPFMDAVFRYNAAYSGGLVRNVLRGSLPGRLLAPDIAALLPLVAACALGLAAGRRMGRSGAIVAAWCAGTLVSVSAPGKFFPHYRQLWMPVLALGAALAVHALGAALGAREGRFRAAASLLLLALVAALQAPSYALPAATWSLRKYGPTYVETEHLGRELRSWLRPDETLFVWGAEPGLYRTSGRRPPSGILYVMPLVAPPLEDALGDRLLRDLDRERPALVVVEAERPIPPGHPFAAWLEGAYVPIEGPVPGPRFRFHARAGSALATRSRPAAEPGPDR